MNLRQLILLTLQSEPDGVLDLVHFFLVVKHVIEVAPGPNNLLSLSALHVDTSAVLVFFDNVQAYPPTLEC